MFKMDLEKAEEPEIKLPTSAGSLRKQESSRKTSTSASLTKAFDCVDHNKLWKILKEMGIPDHLTCLLRNLYAGQEATVRTGCGTTDWFQIRKGVRQGCILSPCLFNYVYHNKLWKILKEMGIPDHLTCLLRNLYAGQEATVKTGLRTTDWFQIRKGVHQGCILSPCLFNLYAEYIMSNAGLDEAQAGIKISGRNINNLRYTDDTTLIAESEELKSLDETKRRQWKSWLKA